MWDYKKFFRNREFRLKLIQALRFIPDRPYLKLVYWLKTGQHLNLEKPVGFNEKLNWLKLNHIHPEYTMLADKLKVRNIIAEKIGEEYLIPILGHWKSFEDIPFQELPEKFVLKCNHDSGSVKIIDKKQLDEREMNNLAKFFAGRLSENSYYNGREYPYRDIEPCIIAEKFMKTTDDHVINDYKFFCFNGIPYIMFIVSGRFTKEKHEDFFDMDYRWLPEIRNGETPSPVCPPKPECFEEMKRLATTLSKGIEAVRMDFYEIDGKVYFGEFTFFSAGGFCLFEPHDWEIKLGNMIQITPPHQN